MTGLNYIAGTTLQRAFGMIDDLEKRIDKAVELIHLWEDHDSRLQPYWDQLLEILVGEEQ